MVQSLQKEVQSEQVKTIEFGSLFRQDSTQTSLSVEIEAENNKEEQKSQKEEMTENGLPSIQKEIIEASIPNNNLEDAIQHNQHPVIVAEGRNGNNIQRKKIKIFMTKFERLSAWKAVCRLRRSLGLNDFVQKSRKLVFEELNNLSKRVENYVDKLHWKIRSLKLRNRNKTIQLKYLKIDSNKQESNENFDESFNNVERSFSDVCVYSEGELSILDRQRVELGSPVRISTKKQDSVRKEEFMGVMEEIGVSITAQDTRAGLFVEIPLKNSTEGNSDQIS